MKLWILLPIENDDADDIFQYDCYHGHVVCAETEQEARTFAFSADEARFYKSVYPNSKYETPWDDPGVTVCKEIETELKGVVLSDFNAG